MSKMVLFLGGGRSDIFIFDSLGNKKKSVWSDLILGSVGLRNMNFFCLILHHECVRQGTRAQFGGLQIYTHPYTQRDKENLSDPYSIANSLQKSQKCYLKSMSKTSCHL